MQLVIVFLVFCDVARLQQLLIADLDYLQLLANHLLAFLGLSDLQSQRLTYLYHRCAKILAIADFSYLD